MVGSFEDLRRFNVISDISWIRHMKYMYAILATSTPPLPMMMMMMMMMMVMMMMMMIYDDDDDHEIHDDVDDDIKCIAT